MILLNPLMDHVRCSSTDLRYLQFHDNICRFSKGLLKSAANEGADGVPVRKHELRKWRKFISMTMRSHWVIRQNLITVIQKLQTLTNLREIDFHDNQITKIEGLGPLFTCSKMLMLSLSRFGMVSSRKSLSCGYRVLDLSFNRIGRIENLNSLTCLKKLFLESNRIEKMENLSHLVNLELLELGCNRIRVIEGLENLRNITALYLGKIKLSKIAHLEHHPKLTILSLQSNRLTKIEGLDTLVNLLALQTLDLASNRITKLENVNHLKGLEEFGNYKNPNSKSTSPGSPKTSRHIAEKSSSHQVSEFEHQVSELSHQFNNNGIDKWEDVNHLAELPKLKTVYLEHNPSRQRRPTDGS
ncbi:putative Protein phosphatase 1 regulatory subunit 7 [Hypsibius exemplaris]|uniref:Protein phosphatase 1 regulatory subunit 7 n=1 Tax=Hypsibius exemplaris TaxID=2072580 RepID=A0A1W0WJ76_HYPEX|nr:putative Protein phosphatase 1 regulatory subunit 7 [Hypsibius exemplaris]